MTGVGFVFSIPLAYQILTLFASVRHLLKKQEIGNFAPPVSVLKPVRGVDPAMYQAFVSQAEQNYPDFELLFGAAEETDPAVPLIRRLRDESPPGRVRLQIGREPGANAKVGTLRALARHAHNPVWVVNDSDIRVTPGYLAEIVAPLQDPQVGVVTCLYRPIPHSLASRWEAFGIAVDFMPSTLVAPLVGVRDFGLGSTLCFRADDLARAGGFAGFADYIADDYQLARRIAGLKKRSYLSRYVVETSLGDGDWRGVWNHQLRWARTIRASKGAGFAGLPVTQAGLWILVALWSGSPLVALALLLLRVFSALVSGWLVIGLRAHIAWALLAPVWDLYAFAIWAASYLSREVRWRDRRLRIKADGRIEEIA